jgi:hypothetical protein
MTSDRRCPCGEELIDTYGCSCGPWRFDEPQRRRTPHTDDDLVIALNDARMAEGNRGCGGVLI